MTDSMAKLWGLGALIMIRIIQQTINVSGVITHEAVTLYHIGTTYT